MHEFRDPAGLGLAAIIAVSAYALLKALMAVMLFGAGPEDLAVAFVSLGYVAALFISYVLVGWWIYRTNSNAHVFSGAMTITPGWSVGWFFVPFANLIMPYQGVKEVWQESHEFAGRHAEMESPLLGWWWGLWIAMNIATNIASFSGAFTLDPSPNALYLNLAAAALSVGASAALILLIRRLDVAQLAASRGGVFA
jgi:hypothetical protein